MLIKNKCDLVEAIRHKLAFDTLLSNRTWAPTKEDSLWYLMATEADGTVAGPDLPFKTRALARVYLDKVRDVKFKTAVLKRIIGLRGKLVDAATRDYEEAKWDFEKHSKSYYREA